MPNAHALFLTHEPPLPAISGTRVRSLNLLRQLERRGWRLSLFSLLTDDGVGEEDRARLGEVCERVVLEPLGASRARRYLRIALATARGRAFQEVYFFSSAAARRFRDELAAEPPDVIVAGELYTYPYVPAALRSRTVLDCYNVELRRVEAMARTLWPRPRGIVARLQRAPVRRLEERAVRSVGGVLAVSESERLHFESLAPGRTTLVPNGVDCESLRPRGTLPAQPSFLFLGSLGYSANLDSARYLLREILPRVRRSDAGMTLVGGKPPDQLRTEAADAPLRVEVTGLVPSTEPYFERSRFLVVPLRFGGGTRLKILESLARGVPVLTTSIGCEGLDLTPGREIMVADDPAEFAGSIDRLLEDDELCTSLSRYGRAKVERLYDWRRIGDRLEGAVTAVAERQA
jgi:glycosyltransferase involved in cell wall biosynthesis